MLRIVALGGHIRRQDSLLRVNEIKEVVDLSVQMLHLRMAPLLGTVI